MKAFVRWLVVACVLVLLIAFPHGANPKPQIAQLRTPIVYFRWSAYLHNLEDLWHRITHGSLGMDVIQGRPVAEMVVSSFASSLVLVAIGLLITIVFGVAKGIYDGVQGHHGGRFPMMSFGLQWLIESLPDFFMILVLEMLSFYLLRHHIQVYFVGSRAFWSGTLVPAVLISLMPAMYLARMVRGVVEEQLGQQYLVAAYAKGLSRRRVIARHVLPNCLPVVLESVVPVIGLLFSNLVMVEYLLYRPGMVSLLFGAMGNKGFAPIYTPIWPTNEVQYYPYDAPLVFGGVLACGLVYGMAWGLARLLLRAVGYRRSFNPYAAPLRESSWRFGVPWQMIGGGVTLLSIVALGVVAHWLPLPSPEQQDVIHFGPNDTITAPPFPPSRIHWLGTDAQGRDMLSRTLHGILSTFGYVLIPVSGIVMAATVLALVSSVWRVQWVRELVLTWSSLVSVVPSVLLALLILQIPDVYWYGVRISQNVIHWDAVHRWVYMAIIGVIEIGRAADAMVHRLEDASAKEYMEAAEISGNSALTKLLIHHWRTLVMVVLELFAVESGRVLLLISTLGFFQYPIMPSWRLESVYSAPVWVFYPSSLDWTALVAENARDFAATPWVLAGPIVFLTITVIALNLLVTGLRIAAQSVPRRADAPPLGWRYEVVRKITSRHGQGRSERQAVGAPEQRGHG
ncbi:MAG: ABC transporter permease subunit [Alicyclobacillus macrosporangiidus]|uniref:ABC transporter permease subunit n=1 Tax=Alicyclobacillus macrosporangiidus TaxID=392015 RepID=UPI0026EA00E6|nr:ABC transporter permease subunit [Alicyclobacillus macrosporangiidus]MCL6599960.1 ABC transporter permease subunit [Alicyclobacillus macrosporangiidus]